MFQTIDEALALGTEHHSAGQTAEARAAYEWILARNPAHAPALHQLGVLAAQMGNPTEAIRLIRQAIAANLGEPTFHTNLGMILEGAGQLDAALACYRQAVNLDPESADSHYRLGNGWRLVGQMPLALASYQEAVRLNPAHAAALSNLGNIHAELDQPDDAITCFERLLQLEPNSAAAHGHLANMLKHTGRIPAAVAEYRKAVELEPANAARHSSLIYALTLDPRVDDAALREELARWSARHAAAAAPWVWRPVAADAEKRLRIGYISPDFRDHVVGRNVWPLLRHHDHQAFEIFCYSNQIVADRMTAEFRRVADHFQVVAGEGDEALAARMRRDGIDILVDLALHTQGNRLGVLARKPAPVQVTFAGYPGSTGLAAVDYRLTDPFLDPPEMGRIFVEEPHRLPASFWCFDPAGEAPAVAELPVKSSGQITFGCLNNFCKVNDDVLGMWCRILDAVPHSRLMSLAPAGSYRERTGDFLERCGIARERILFKSKCPRRDYLRLYNDIDLALDTVPYNGHTTSLDSLFMGVPVVTLVGRTVVGRAGLSQLSNLGLGELMAQSPEEYVRLAAALAGDVPRLAQLRGTLRQRMAQSRLMDGPGFARDIELAYRTMWRTWCARGRAD